MMGVQYTDLIPLTIAAIKELSVKNTDLETRLETVQNTLDILAARMSALESK